MSIATLNDQVTNTETIARRSFNKEAILVTGGETEAQRVERAREHVNRSAAYAVIEPEILAAAAKAPYKALFDARRKQLEQRPQSAELIACMMERDVHGLGILYMRGYVEHGLFHEALLLQETAQHVVGMLATEAGRDEAGHFAGSLRTEYGKGKAHVESAAALLNRLLAATAHRFNPAV